MPSIRNICIPLFPKFQRYNGKFAWQETPACKRFLVIRMWVRLVIPRESCESFYLFLSFSCAIRGLSVHPISELPSTFLCYTYAPFFELI